MLCPLDCGACRDPSCRAEGCKLTGETMLDACDLCGEIVTSSSHIVFCASCEAEPVTQPGGTAAR